MSLCVEDVLVEVDQVHVIGEEEEQVLEGLPQEETLHLVSGFRVAGVLHIVDGCVATSGDLGGEKEGEDGLGYDSPTPL